MCIYALPLLQTNFRAVPKGPKEHSGHNRHTPATRRAAVLAVARTFEGEEPDYARAVAEYKNLPKKLAGDTLGKNAATVLKTHWEHFMTSGDLADGPRSGRPTQISDEDALVASEAIKAGKKLTRRIKGGTITLITYFTTVREAIIALPGVKAIMDKYDTTPRKLYMAMKRADPYLKRRSIVLKPAFTEAQKKDRRSFAQRLLAEWNLSAAEFRAILSRIVQCDEGRFTYTVYSKEHKKVLIDRRTTLLHDYVTLPKIDGEEELTVHFFICVSAHPAFAKYNGLVYWELTTGTSHIKRVFNTLSDDDEEHVYQVRWLPCYTSRLPKASALGAVLTCTASGSASTCARPSSA